jgi:hypothetical protein
MQHTLPLATILVSVGKSLDLHGWYIKSAIILKNTRKQLVWMCANEGHNFFSIYSD